MNPKLDKNGYLCLGLCTNEVVSGKEHRRKMFRVAGLVVREFKGNPPEAMCDPTVDHADGNKTNNHISNLRWMERVENSASRKNRPIGTKNASAKLSEKDVAEIKQLLFQDRLSLREIGDRYGVKRSTIFSIKKQKTWKEVTEHESAASS